MNRYATIITGMPPGLDRAVARAISYHVGKANAIGRNDLVAAVKHLGFSTVHERQVRETIKELRRSGHVICSMPGEDGGYFLAGSMQEYKEFKAKEFLSKISDMQETLTAMDQAARAQFGDGAYQPGLLGQP